MFKFYLNKNFYFDTWLTYGLLTIGVKIVGPGIPINSTRVCKYDYLFPVIQLILLLLLLPLSLKPCIISRLRYCCPASSILKTLNTTLFAVFGSRETLEQKHQRFILGCNDSGSPTKPSRFSILTIDYQW